MQKINNQIIEKMPDNYKEALKYVIEEAEIIYKDNLVDIFLAGSAGREHIIENWSDLDLYFILLNFDIESNAMFYSKIKDNKYGIHIGTTFYTKSMIEDLYIDSKTFATFYEYQNYNLNTFIYNKIKLKNIDFRNVVICDKEFNNLLQVVFREIYNYKLNKNNFKTLIKKMTLLVKAYIIKKYKIYIYNYNNIFNEFNRINKIKINIDIEKIINENYLENEQLDYFYDILNIIMEGMMKK